MPAKTGKNELRFEEAANRLEEIVALMDDPATGMEQMIALAEEGLKLLRSGKKMLAEAELKIQKLEAPDEAEPDGTEPPDEGGNGFSLH